MDNDLQISRFPVHPHETKGSVLLARARDVLNRFYEDRANSTEISDLVYDIDVYLVEQAQKKGGAQ